MSTEQIQQQTSINVQERANLIWDIADNLVGIYKPHEYGNVILPMCVTVALILNRRYEHERTSYTGAGRVQ